MPKKQPWEYDNSQEKYYEFFDDIKAKPKIGRPRKEPDDSGGYDGLILQRRVLHLCKRKYLSTARAESMLGFANGTIKKLNRNTPSAARIYEIAKFFDVSSDYLLGLTDKKTTPRVDKIEHLWKSLDIDQQNYILGFIEGIVKYEQYDNRDAVRSEPLIMKRRRAIRNEIDQLQTEYSALEKIRKKKGYKDDVQVAASSS